VLNQRLAELTGAQPISQDVGNRYQLTPLGQALGNAVAPLDQWAKTRARQTAAAPKQP
jgi:DNA-binding HxlR family transcriptional regulator